MLNLNEPHNHVDRRVKKVVTHRNFDKFTYEYDIALLEMQADIKFQPNIIPICLPNSDSSLVGQIGTAELAAVSLGNSFLFIAMSIGIGFSIPSTELVG